MTPPWDKQILADSQSIEAMAANPPRPAATHVSARVPWEHPEQPNELCKSNLRLGAVVQQAVEQAPVQGSERELRTKSDAISGGWERQTTDNLAESGETFLTEYFTRNLIRVLYIAIGCDTQAGKDEESLTFPRQTVGHPSPSAGRDHAATLEHCSARYRINGQHATQLQAATGL